MWRGSAAVDDQFAYFAPCGYNSVYRYNLHREQWETLPANPYYDSALVIINGYLTIVGGRNITGPSNNLLTLGGQQWIHGRLPMKTARSKAAVVSTSYSTNNYLIVMGGYERGGWTDAVEVFDVEEGRWIDLLPNKMLPKTLEHPTATTCGNRVHVIGQHGEGFSCSLQDLLERHTSPARFHAVTWTALPPLPVAGSTMATIGRQLVLIGGRQGGLPVKTIHQLRHKEWVEIGSMSTGRERCLAVSPLPDTLLIVGGVGKRDVQECVVV